jgi:hypothetical protein
VRALKRDLRLRVATAIAAVCIALVGGIGVARGRVRAGPGLLARRRAHAAGNRARQPRAPAGAETVSLRGCVDAAAEPYRDEAARKGLELEIHIADGETVQADRKALQLVLANLVKNAVRYTDRGHVRIAYEAPRLIVSGSGPGIDSHHLPQLFDRFYRADQQRAGRRVLVRDRARLNMVASFWRCTRCTRIQNLAAGVYNEIPALCAALGRNDAGKVMPPTSGMTPCVPRMCGLTPRVCRGRHGMMPRGAAGGARGVRTAAGKKKRAPRGRP